MATDEVNEDGVSLVRERETDHDGVHLVRDRLAYKGPLYRGTIENVVADSAAIARPWQRVERVVVNDRALMDCLERARIRHGQMAKAINNPPPFDAARFLGIYTEDGERVPLQCSSEVWPGDVIVYYERVATCRLCGNPLKWDKCLSRRA